MCIWVDDGIVCSTSKEELDGIVRYLNQQFEITTGPVDLFVGIKIRRDRAKKIIHLSQEKYLKKILEKFNMSDCHSRLIPDDPSCHLTKITDCPDEEKVYPYREAIGSLIFAATCTRPEIAYAVNQAAQFSNSPKQQHWMAMKRILTYLRGIIGYGIWYGGVENEKQLVAYTDADFAANIEDRRSTSGVLLMLNGGPMAWISHRQKCVSLSTTESEYVAAASGSKEIIWMRRLLGDIDWKQPNPTPLLCDNQSAIRLVRNPELHQRTKHIDVKCHSSEPFKTTGPSTPLMSTRKPSLLIYSPRVWKARDSAVYEAVSGWRIL